MSMETRTFLQLALPMFAALAAMVVLLCAVYVVYRLLEWACVRTRFWLWRRRHGR